MFYEGILLICVFIRLIVKNIIIKNVLRLQDIFYFYEPQWKNESNNKLCFSLLSFTSLRNLKYFQLVKKNFEDLR